MIYLLYDHSSQYQINFMTLCFKIFNQSFMRFRIYGDGLCWLSCEFFKVLVN